MCGAHQHAEHQTVSHGNSGVGVGWMDKELNNNKCVDDEGMEDMGNRKRREERERKRITMLLCEAPDKHTL